MAAEYLWPLGTWEVEWSPGVKNTLKIFGFEKETKIKGEYFADGGETCPVMGVQNRNQAFIELSCKAGITRLMGELVGRFDFFKGEYSHSYDSKTGLFTMQKVSPTPDRARTP